MSLDPSRLYALLLKTGLQQKDNRLYQVIHNLIGAIVSQDKTSSSTSIISGGGSTVLTQVIQGPPGSDGLDGDSDYPGIPPCIGEKIWARIGPNVITPTHIGDVIDSTGYIEILDTNTPELHYNNSSLTFGRGWWAQGIDQAEAVPLRNFIFCAKGYTFSITDGGTTLNSPTLTSPSQANFYSAVAVGFVVTGVGIPVGTTIISVESLTSCTMSANATANGSNITVKFSKTNQNVNDVVEAAHNGFAEPTFGFNVLPPDMTFGVHIKAGSLGTPLDVTRGNLYLHIGNGQTGDLLAADSQNFPKSFRLMYDGSVQFQSGATNPLVVQNNAGSPLFVVSTNNNYKVGIGVTPTTNTGFLHIYRSSSGQTANTNAFTLVLETSGNTGISILSGNASQGNIYFGDDGSASAGLIRYTHGTDLMQFGTSDSFRVTIGNNYLYTISGCNVGIGTGASPSATLHVKGTTGIIRLDNTSIGASALALGMAGIEVSCAGMNTTTAKYGSALKFMSTDPDLTTQNPKLLAAIVPRATEVYNGDTKGGMAIDIATTPNTPGATSIPVICATFDQNGSFGLGVVAPTAILHLKAGSVTASTAPLKFTSGTLLGTAEAGAVEFLTDAFYGTITTGAARKTFAFLESPAFTGTVTVPDIKLGTAGNGIYIKEGANATSGIATLVAGTVTISTTKVTANSRIYLSPQTLGTILRPVGLGVTARVAATSFTITSMDITDTSDVAWLIVEPA